MKSISKFESPNSATSIFFSKLSLVVYLNLFVNNTLNNKIDHLATGVLVLPFHSADILGEGFPKMTEGSMTCLVLSIFLVQ